jgi:hypothetical protein
MKKLFGIGAVTLALGFGLIGTETANGQTTRREARREYRGEIRQAQLERRDDIREARRDFRNDVRSGQNRRAAAMEYRDEIRDANREFRSDRRESLRDYRNDVRRTSTGWYRTYNGRRQFYPFSRYFYRNGQFIRRY